MYEHVMRDDQLPYHVVTVSCVKTFIHFKLRDDYKHWWECRGDGSLGENHLWIWNRTKFGPQTLKSVKVFASEASGTIGKDIKCSRLLWRTRACWSALPDVGSLKMGSRAGLTWYWTSLESQRTSWPLPLCLMQNQWQLSAVSDFNLLEMEATSSSREKVTYWEHFDCLSIKFEHAKWLSRLYGTLKRLIQDILTWDLTTPSGEGVRNYSGAKLLYVVHRVSLHGRLPWVLTRHSNCMQAYGKVFEANSL